MDDEEIIIIVGRKKQAVRTADAYEIHSIRGELTEKQKRKILKALEADSED